MRQARHGIIWSTTFLSGFAGLSSGLLLFPTGALANCTTVGGVTTCDTSAPNPYTTRIGTGQSDNNRTVTVGSGATVDVTQNNAISLGDGTTITINGTVRNTANLPNGAGTSNTGNNTVEFKSNSTLTINSGGSIIASGTSTNSEAINPTGFGNTIVNRGLIQATNSAAIWFEDRVTGAKNTVDNYGTIEKVGGGNVMGSSGSSGITFYNRTNAKILGNLTFSGGNDDLIFEANSTASGAINGGGGTNNLTLQGAAGSNDTLPGSITNFTTLTKDGSGQWTVSGSLSGFTIVTVKNGVLALTGNNAGYTGNLVVDPTGILEARAQSLPTKTPASANVNNVQNNGLVRFTQSDDGTYTGQITGSGSVVKLGAGVLTLTPAVAAGNTFLGGLSINQGTVAAAADNALGAASGGVTFNGGTLQLNSSFNLNGGRALTLNAAGGAIDTQGFQSTVGQAITGAGALTKAGTGTLTLTGTNSYGGGTTIAGGTLQLGNGGASGSITGDVANNGTLAFNRSDAITFGGLISGSGMVRQDGSGVTTLTGANSYTGTTTVSAGTLIVNGNQAAATGATNVSSGATIGGTGTIGGSVTIADGGTLAPGNVGTTPGALTVNGALGLNQNSNLNYNFGQANVAGGAFNDLTNVGGDLTLDGKLNVNLTPGGSFDPGVYRIINYGGTLHNNTLDIASLPPGTPPNTFFVQTSVEKQVNLVNTAGLQLTFWDGNAPGSKNNGTVNGGNGTWQNAGGLDNWTDQSGTVNAPWADSGFAVFMATPGTVTVDNGNGAVRAAGMQFASDGYVIRGDTLTLVGGPSSTIRVGDGTAAGAGYTATINSALTGATQLVKTDLGTLVLNGANTYSGGTAINGGTLQASSDGNLGAASGGLTFNGGTLRLGASFDVNAGRAVTLNAGGGTIDTQGYQSTLGQGITGSGALTKVGTGTLTLTGANAYTGGTTISAGTLQLGNGGASGSLVGNVTNNATLAFNRSDTATFGGLISGSGTVRQVGTGTTVLTGANTYSGGTTISAGTLQLGNGGASGSLVGDVTNNAALAFNRSDTVTFGGLISGTGTVRQIGTGTTVLTGTNTYSGGTTISAGMLQLGNGGTSGSITGDVTNNATLAFNRSDAITFGGLISGSGAVRQDGTGVTTLTGANSYTGTTTVSAGTLIVNGNQAAATGATNVSSGATIGGTGTIGGSVTVADGGTLAPGNVGTTPGALTINGALNLNQNSNLNYNFGQANVVGGAFNDLTNVGGDLTLDGKLNVNLTPGGSFDPGIYRVISYTGTLHNNTLDIGSLPPGTPPNTFFVQTSVEKQVNLVNTAGLQLNFWDGNAGPKNNATVNGGDGTWQNAAGGLDNWTNQSGAINAPWADSGFAVFMATPGTVTVDNGNGAVRASGMQFASNGYVIQGGTLTLVGGPSSTIRVGDGTAAGAGYTATINSVLTGATQLVKTDLGTLVLNGNNTYTGGTAINGGTLQVSSDGNLGAASGGLSFNGGTLRLGASFDVNSSRAVTLNAGGGTIDTQGYQSTLGQGITGSGALTKVGTGTLTLTGANAYTGGTTISAGTLQLGNGGASGSLVGDVTNNATLAFNRSDTATFAGVISGSGTVRQIGTGTTALTGASNYSGGTTISAGTLQLGNGGASGSITGDVTNNGALAFNRSDAFSFGGLISGSGTVQQIGTGVTTLTGTNSYTGTTTVSAGTLIVNGNQTAATGVTNVSSGATIGGTGTIGGSVTVADGGTLAPGNVGTTPGALTINGALNLNQNSNLNYNFGQANVVGGAFNDLTNVGGDLTLDGKLNVNLTPGGSFDPGIYRVISYTGTLHNNTLDIGSLPPGTPPNTFFVQTSVEKQVNLVNTAGLQLTFWDGDAGPKNNSTVNGGNGTWQNAGVLDNWTNQSGTPNAPWADGGFAVFMATPGTVTVDNGNGAVRAAGMQFASNGYVIQGGTLTLVGAPTSTIRVGDGTAAGAGYTATINSVLAGSSQLVKSDLGTLVLNGTNSYSGGTAINGGTLQLGNGGTTGSIVGNVTNNATLAFNRSDANTFGGLISGTGTVQQIGTGTTVLTGTNTYSGGTTISAGTLQLGNGGASGSITGNVANNATLAFNRSDANAFGGLISGTGTVRQDGTGITTLTGTNSYTGTTTVSAGTLIVNGNQTAATGATSVNSGATIGGTGTIGGNVTVADGGTLSPGDAGATPGTLTINGALGLSQTSNLNYSFGQANVVGGAFNDLTNVGGNLTLDGKLNVNLTPGGSFDPGVYRVINYTGSLTNNTLDIGSLPPGTPPNSFFVQTSVDKQVNLVNTAGLQLNFWDGNAGPKNNGAVNGGNGTWQNAGGLDNWTDQSGAVNAPWADGGFAVFMATPGTVTVDNGNGAVRTAGMQFASNGYVIQGGTLTLVGSPTSIVKVGDGTAGGAAYTATINSVLAGSSQLVKTDLGTLVLNGANSYSGGTAINGGMLQVSSDGNLGAASGGLSFNGGTLRLGASFDVNAGRAVTLNAAGGTVDTQAFQSTLGQGITGAGALTKAGTGTLTLTGANAYTGGTTITAGTVQLGNGGTSGSLIGNVTNNATLAFNRSDTATFAGVISGTGTVQQIGTGTTVLTGASTYSSGTTISAGTLQLGNGGASGSIAGNVVNNGTLAFNRSDAFSFGNGISGTGGVRQIGTGTTVLTGVSSYSGATTVASGTLAPGAANIFSPTSAFSVLAGGTLALQDLDQKLASLSNAGLVDLGAGKTGTTLTVSGDYAGNGGTVQIATALGGDNSLTDRLMVNGGTSGSSLLKVANAGGIGAPTTQGIKVIQVDGASNGMFSLVGDFTFHGDPSIVAGAYAYRLFQGGVSTPADGNWYLRSQLKTPPGPDPEPQLNPGVPVYEVYPQHLLGMNGLPTLQQRTGNRYWSGAGANVVAQGADAPAENPAPDGVTPTAQEGRAFWGRIEGMHNSIDPAVSTSNASYDQNIFRLQSGLDLLLAENEAGRLLGGIAMHYVHGKTKVSAPSGDGSISSDGYGLGGTLTWYGNNGFYVDGQAQATWYDSDLSSATAGRSLVSGNNGFGYALSLETGKRFAVGEGLTLTPQAQLTYSRVKFDSFVDPFGAGVAIEDGDSLLGRLGISLDRENSWTGEDGTLTRSHLYGLANLRYEFLQGTRVDVATVDFANRSDRFWGEVGIGGSYNWNDDKYSVYGEGSVATSLSNFGGSNAIKGTLGFRVKW